MRECSPAGGSSLSYDAESDTCTYVWKTEGSWAGTCRQLIVRLNDGSERVAFFKFQVMDRRVGSNLSYDATIAAAIQIGAA